MEGVAGVDDARLDWNLLTLEAIRIAGAVPALVLRPNDGTQRGKEGHGSKNALADNRVLAHDGKFLGRQRSGLLQDVAGDADLADVVEQGTILQQAQLVGRQMKALSDVDSELGGFPRVRLGVPIFRVQGGGQGPDRCHVALFLLPAPGLVLIEQRLPDASRDVSAQHGRDGQHDQGPTVVAVPAVDEEREGPGGGRQQGDRRPRAEAIRRRHEHGGCDENRQDMRVNAAGRHQHEAEQHQAGHDDDNQESLHRQPVPGEEPAHHRPDIREDADD